MTLQSTYETNEVSIHPILPTVLCVTIIDNFFFVWFTFFSHSMRQSVNISVNLIGFFFPYNVNAVKLSWSTSRRYDAPHTRNAGEKSLFWFTNARAFHCLAHTYIFSYVFFLSFFVEWVVSQTNWRDDDDNALVPRELLFSFHEKSIVLRSLMCCLDYELFCFDCTPPRASNNSILVWAEAEWMNECVISCASLMMHFLCWHEHLLVSISTLFIYIYHVCITLDASMHWKFTQLVCARPLNLTFYILVDFVYFFCFFFFFHLCFYFNLPLIRCALVSAHKNQSRMNEAYVNEHENCTFHFKLH